MLSIVDLVYNKLGEILDQYPDIKAKVIQVKADRTTEYNDLQNKLKFLDQFTDK